MEIARPTDGSTIGASGNPDARDTRNALKCPQMLLSPWPARFRPCR